MKQKSGIYSDPHFILLNINAALVLIGYALSVYSDSASVGIMKVLKSFFIVMGILLLFKDLRITQNSRIRPRVMYILLFSFVVVMLSFVSEDIKFALTRTMNFLVPFLYIYFALHCLLRRYPSMEVLNAFIWSINWVYCIPITAYLLSGAGFSNINIYGEGSAEGQLFVSNHYGWASAVYLLSSVDILLNRRPRRLYRYFLIFFSLIAFYLLLISGNRSSWVSVAIALIVFILRLKNIRVDYKILMILLPLAITFWLLSKPGSSLNVRFHVTQNQFQHGEERLSLAQLAASKFNRNKILWLTGAGMFNYQEILHNGGGDYHDSYLEILFGGGIFLFILFLNFMVFRPLYNYVKYYSKYYLIIAPLMIIPLFESNLTGGQFLFFPWFIFMFLFNIRPSLPERIPAKKTHPRRKLAYDLVR